MELRQLRYFVVAANYLNFTDASKQLFITQPTLSQQIAGLENEIGVQLFSRKAHSIQLTTVGKVFLEEANAIIARCEQAIKVTHLANSGVQGTLVIGYLMSPVKRFLPRLLSIFRKRYSKINLNLSHITYFPLLKALERRDVDIGLMTAFNPGYLVNREFASKVIYTTTLCVMVQQDHPLANQSKVKLSDLADESFVFMAREHAPEQFDVVINLFERQGILPKIVAQPHRMEHVALFVESGIGISIVPKYVGIYDHSSSICLLDFDEARSYDIVAAWKKENTNPIIPRFVEVLQEMIEV
jgi:DNA-binding transcriptional LysR family regulator